jgi:hypothetical protein
MRDRRLTSPPLAAGALWFAAMFGLGFLLGPIRVTLLEPRLGPTLAVLIEAVPMIAAMILLAPRIARRLAVPRTADARLVMGGIGLLLLVLAETTLDALLRGRGPDLWVERTRTPDGLIYFGLLALFALMPYLRRSAG